MILYCKSNEIFLKEKNGKARERSDSKKNIENLLAISFIFNISLDFFEQFLIPILKFFVGIGLLRISLLKF